MWRQIEEVSEGQRMTLMNRGSPRVHPHSRKCLAERGMSDAQHTRRLRDAAFGQEDIEHVKLVPLQIGFITVGNSVYDAASVVGLIWRA
jgi:hypothetical protein